MATTTKVEDLTNLGNITTGDTVVGERVAGTTGSFTYRVEVAEDTTPQLGGHLDVNGKKITSASAGNIIIEPDTTGAIIIGGNASQSTEVQFKEDSSNGSNYMGLKAPAAVTTSTSLILPDGDGSANQTLKTDGSGNLGWQTSYYSGGTDVIVADGGTGRSTATAYAPLCGGTTATGAHQSATSGSTGQLFVSQGSATLPTWTTPTYPTASGTSGKILQSDGTNIGYSTATFPTAATTGKLIRADGTNYLESTSTFADTYGASELLYSNGANTVEGLTTANSSVLVTNGSGVPSLATDIPTAVTIGSGYIYRAGGTDVPVADGGTGVSSNTAYAVLCGGTTSTGAVQSIAGVGTSGQVLTSNGAGALPTFQSSDSNPNGPVFRATPSAFTVDTSFDKIPFDTATIDTASDFDTVNNRYTASTAGYYSIQALTFGSTTNRVGLSIYKNGSEYSTKYQIGTTTSGGGNYDVRDVVHLNGSTDYVEIFAIVDSGTMAINTSLTSFTGILMSTAT